MTEQRQADVFLTLQQIVFLLILLLNLSVISFISISAYNNYCENNSIITRQILESVKTLKDQGKITESSLKSLAKFTPNIYFNSNTIAFFFNIFTISFIVLGGYLLTRNKNIHDKLKFDQDQLDSKLINARKSIEIQTKSVLEYSKIEADVFYIKNKISDYFSATDICQKISIIAEFRECLKKLNKKLFTCTRNNDILSTEHWKILQNQLLILDTINDELDYSDKNDVNKCKSIIDGNLDDPGNS